MTSVPPGRRRRSWASDRYFFAFDAEREPRRVGGVLAIEHRLLRAGGCAGWRRAPSRSRLERSWCLVVQRGRGPRGCRRGVRCRRVQLRFLHRPFAVAADDRGDLVYLYDAATQDLGPQRIFARRSTDGGLTWTDRQRLSRWSEHRDEPGGGVDRERGRASVVRGDGAQDTTPERLEHLVPVVVGRRPLVERAGEALGCEHGGRIQVGGRIPKIYGDYGEMAITSAGRTIAVWGEGFSWTGPGGAWFNRQS